jgi:hypothetical protein
MHILAGVRLVDTVTATVLDALAVPGSIWVQSKRGHDARGNAVRGMADAIEGVCGRFRI